MPKQIFVNLPVADLSKAKSFYEAIGAVNKRITLQPYPDG